MIDLRDAMVISTEEAEALLHVIDDGQFGVDMAMLTLKQLTQLRKSGSVAFEAVMGLRDFVKSRKEVSDG